MHTDRAVHRNGDGFGIDFHINQTAILAPMPVSSRTPWPLVS
jgi:hypothetical protein